MAETYEREEVTEVASLMKGGKQVFRVSLNRTLRMAQLDDPVGFTVNVWVHPDVESWMKSLGTGESEPVEPYGKTWVQLPDQKPLEIWNATRYPDRTGLFRIDQPGKQLVFDGDEINMSFLRLTGVSRGDGVMFGIKTILSTPGLVELRTKIQGVIRQLYIDYMKPATASVSVSVQDF